jgi:hypothetical protein
MTRASSDNATGADNQQERPVIGSPIAGILRGHTPDTLSVKRWSDLHGDMQLTKMPKVAKFLVG